MILVVDDDTAIREILPKILAKAGYESETAANGKEALNLLQAGKVYDLIILDLMMPIMDGNEFMEEILNNGYDIPIILLTGYLGDLKAELRMTPVALMEKPFIFDKIIAEVKKHV